MSIHLLTNPERVIQSNAPQTPLIGDHIRGLKNIYAAIILLIAAIGCIYLAKISFFAHAGISALILAIILGILYSHTLHPKLTQSWSPSIQWSSKYLLRAGIILYGVRVNVGQILDLGINTVLIDIGVVALTLTIGTWIGVKWLKLDRHTALLVSAGSAICGAAAVMAMESTLKSAPHKTCIAVGTVVLFGTAAMFGLPLWLHWIGTTELQSGIITGASVHEVAQVVVAGNQISSYAGNLAVVVKMTRVLLLVPTLTIISMLENRHNRKNNQTNLPSKASIPWFAVGFIAVILLNSSGIISHEMANTLYYIDIGLLTAAMAGIGIETHFSKIKSAGFKPIILAAILAIGLLLGVTGITLLI